MCAIELLNAVLIKKLQYPEEPEFPQFPDYNNLFVERSVYNVENLTHNQETKNTPCCNKCKHGLNKMLPSPRKWICDMWDPPNSYCEGGNGKEYTNNDVAFCCPNYNFCNWVICKRCYDLLLNNKETYPHTEPDRSCELDYSSEGMRRFLDDRAAEGHDQKCCLISRDSENQKLLEKEQEQQVKQNLKYAPVIKNIKSYQEYLDLTRGFYLTQPHCEKYLSRLLRFGGKKTA